MRQIITYLLFMILSFSVSAKPLFKTSFDGSVAPSKSVIQSLARIYDKIEYTDGIKGEAVIIGGKRRIIYPAGKNLNLKHGSCSFWVAPLNWNPSTKNFVFFISFTKQHNKTTSDLFLYKFCQSTELAFVARNSAKRQSIKLSKDIAFWKQKKWHNIVVTWDDKVFTFFIDGVKISQRSRIEQPQTFKDIIVGIPYPSWGFLGEELTAIDELLILDECLSSSEVKQRYTTMLKNIQQTEQQTTVPLIDQATFHASFDKSNRPDKAIIDSVKSYGGEAGFSTGIKNNAIELAGKAKKRLRYETAKNLNTNQGSCIVWVKPEWNPNVKDCYFFISCFNKKGRLLLYKNHSGAQITLLIQNYQTKKTIILKQSIVNWQLGQWHQLAFTWKAGSYRLYVDEAQNSSDNKQIAMQWTKIVLGTALPAWAKVGTGKTAFDEFIILPHAVSATTIKHYYNSIINHNPSMINAIKAQKTKEIWAKDNNLALASNGCWILASSFANYNTLYPDNLIDNNFNTAWRPKENEYPQYLELRWQYPRIIDKISFSKAADSIIKAATVKSLNRITGEWEIIKKISPAELQKGEVSLPETTCDQLRFVIEKAKDKVTLFELGAYGPPQPIVGKAAPYWDAWYIWYPEPDQVHKGGQPRYFRRTFNLTTTSFKTAFIQARSNDYYRIWLNGHEVATGSTVITPVNVTKYLKQGGNVIAVEANLKRDPGRWGWGELIVELSINYQNKSLRIGTGHKWKSFNQKLTNWKLVDFDDHNWSGVYCYKKPPAGPWGRIAYHCTSVREKIKLAKVEISPKVSQPGSAITVSAKLKPESLLGRDYFFTFELGKQAINSRNGDYIVTREIVKSTPTQGQTMPFVITAKIPIPPWTPAGKIPLRLRGYDLKSGIELDLSGIKDNIITNINIHSPKTATAVSGTSKIAYPKGQAAFIINNQTTSPLFWRYIYSSNPKRSYVLDKYSNIKIHHFVITKIINKTHNIWPVKLAELERRITTLLAVIPDAYIIIESDLRPSMQWLQSNPTERLITAFGDKDVVSYASKKYRNESRKFLKYMLDYLKKQSYWNRIVGFQVASCGVPDSVMGGVTSNVWESDRNKITAGDFNPQALALFRNFLRKKYNNNLEALRKSWNKPKVEFNNAMPNIKELVAEGENGNVFRNPIAGRMAFDYAEFLPTLLGSFIRECSRFIKDETNWGKMIFAHYGYTIAHMQSYNLPGSQLNNNNFDMATSLKDPAIDGYIGAPSYSNRLAGTPLITYFLWTSIRLHGRMYLPDDDNRTFVAGFKNYGRNRSIRETRAITQRNIGADITRNFGSWFADMSRVSGRAGTSFFAEKEVVESVEQMNKVYQQAMKIGYKSAAEIAVVFSCKSPKFNDIYYGSTLYNNLIQWMFYSTFFKLGAPFDLYMASDLKSPNFPRQQYKLIVMMNTFYLPEDDRKAIEKLKNNGRTFLWFYAPNYIDWQHGLKTDNITAITGIKIKELPGKEQMQAILSGIKHPLTANLKSQHQFKALGFAYPATKKLHPTEFGPRFRIIDNKAQIIANFSDGQGAIAARDFGTWKSVYSIIPRLDSKFLRNICRWAGVHIYTDEDIAFDANKNFIVLHNGYKKERNINLKLPRTTDVFDALSGKQLGVNIKQLKLTLEKCSTTILYLK